MTILFFCLYIYVRFYVLYLIFCSISLWKAMIIHFKFSICIFFEKWIIFSFKNEWMYVCIHKILNVYCIIFYLMFTIFIKFYVGNNLLFWFKIKNSNPAWLVYKRYHTIYIYLDLWNKKFFKMMTMYLNYCISMTLYT